ncbi:CTP synthetase [Actibacterium sp. D379-3]
MLRLALILFSLISTTLMGSAIVVVLVAGYDTLVPILAAAAAGFVVAVPVSWAVARNLASS